MEHPLLEISACHLRTAASGLTVEIKESTASRIVKLVRLRACLCHLFTTGLPKAMITPSESRYVNLHFINNLNMPRFRFWSRSSPNISYNQPNTVDDACCGPSKKTYAEIVIALWDDHLQPLFANSHDLRNPITTQTYVVKQFTTKSLHMNCIRHELSFPTSSFLKYGNELIYRIHGLFTGFQYRIALLSFYSGMSRRFGARLRRS